MKRYIYIVISIVLICLSSCNKEESVSFGTVDYYPSFLWVNSSLKPVTKTFFFDFSQDAKDYGSYAEFQLVDNEGKAISTDVIQVFFDGKESQNNRFRISSEMTSKDITFSFTPQAPGGKHQGYLKLVSHTLDRLNNIQDLTDNQDVLQWTLYFDKRMNPLAKVLIWILIIIVSSFVVWFFILRPFFYPQFEKFNKSILIQKEDKLVGQFNCAFKGARKVVFANQKQEQSALNKLLTGRIKTIVNPLFDEPIIFIPRKKGKVAHVKGNEYIINPNPILKNGKAEIYSTVKKIFITLN